MNEEAIKKLYIAKPDAEVKLLCSYTTRREGFLDILLSGCLLSSEEAMNLLGNVKTHRGNSMKAVGESNHFDTNNSISFSTGFVSYKYSNPSITKREDFIGGLGVLVPLERILEHPYLGFSHCSKIGEIKNYKLNKDNIREAVHIARKQGVLYDDGYGNVFEVSLEPELKKKETFFANVKAYPRLSLIENGISIAIPEFEKGKIEKELRKKQEAYKRFLDKIIDKDLEEMQWKTIDGRNLFYIKKMIPFIKKLVKPFDLDRLPIVWYKERNLDIALQSLAIS